jgi:hypothetical protein
MPQLALDHAPASVRRRYDGDGRLRVSGAKISRATVNTYRGDEIPDWEALGLDAARTYRLLRPAHELRRAAATLGGVPVLNRHVPVDEDHPRDAVVGALANDAGLDGNNYLTCSLTIWDARAIAGVKSGDRSELSLGYAYTPEMVPGSFDGRRYDGVMRGVVADHVALVPMARVWDCAI